MDAVCCCQCPAAFISLLCSRATTQNPSKNAEVINMPSSCNVATIVVWRISIDPIARKSLLCSGAVIGATQKSEQAIWKLQKDVDKPKQLTGTNACGGTGRNPDVQAIGSWARQV